MTPENQSAPWRRSSLARESYVRELQRYLPPVPTEESPEPESSLTPENLRRFARGRLGSLATEPLVDNLDEEILPSASNS